MSNNPPEVVVGLDRADAELLVESCEANIVFALNALTQVSRETAEKLVKNIEHFKRIRNATQEALK